MFSEEERALLNSDEELFALRAQMRRRRQADAAAEDDVAQREALLDEMIEVPLKYLLTKNDSWKEWVQIWRSHLEIEEALVYQLDVLAEKLMWIEDDEIAARKKFYAAAEKEAEKLFALERLKRRYLTESLAWVEDWMERKDEEWGDDRRAVAERQHAFLTERTQAEIDDEEIAALKGRLGKLLGKAAAQ